MVVSAEQTQPFGHQRGPPHIHGSTFGIVARDSFFGLDSQSFQLRLVSHRLRPRRLCYTSQGDDSNEHSRQLHETSLRIIESKGLSAPY
jgi:hypothetical protein